MSSVLENKNEINSINNMSNNMEEMSLHKLSKKELLAKCEGLGIAKCKSKPKLELVALINLINVKKQ